MSGANLTEGVENTSPPQLHIHASLYKKCFLFFHTSCTPGTDEALLPDKKTRKVPKGVKRPWAKKHKSPDPNLELCKVMHSFQKSPDAACSSSKEQESNISSDMHYCMSLAERMSSLNRSSKHISNIQLRKYFLNWNLVISS